MLSTHVIRRKEIDRVASYYGDSADDYYGKEGESQQWQGKGADQLGLRGDVQAKRFRELLGGDIGAGVHRTRDATRKDQNERLGIDLTFSAPKSVTLQAFLGGDKRVIEAHDRAVTRAVAMAEQFARTRRKVQGKSKVEHTGNLIVAKFRHETNREQEPDLHTHAVALNLTQRKDGQWRALENSELLRSTKYLGAMYRAELAIELQSIGYELRFGRDGMFELAHMSREQIQAFSQRSRRIEQALAEKGLTRESATAAEKQQATMKTRKAKVSANREELFASWQKVAAEVGLEFGAERRQRERGEPQVLADSFGPVVSGYSAKQSVRYAIAHLTEREAVMTHDNLLNTALQHAVGRSRLQDVEAEIGRLKGTGYLVAERPHFRLADDVDGTGRTREDWTADLIRKGLTRSAARERVSAGIVQGGLVPMPTRYTTQTALEAEKQILRIERDGRSAVKPALDKDRITAALTSYRLNFGQKEAVSLILGTANRVVGVQGLAGSGKSHMLDAAKTELERSGLKVRALAPYGAQVKALRTLGVESNTLASFLVAKNKKIDERTVIVIDEAGVVPAKLMRKTLQIAEKAGARVVLLGDVAQTKAIEAGRPFEQLQHAGMATATMSEIQRQRAPKLKQAVELAADGRGRDSLSKIASIEEIVDDRERRVSVASHYVRLTPKEREATLIVSGTNEARREINRHVREGLGLAGEGREYDALIRRDTTQAERRHAKNYFIGDLLQPEQDYKSGLKRGRLYKIVDTGPKNQLTLRYGTEQPITINPSKHKKLSVYEPTRLELARDDLVRITRNDAGLDVANGDRFRVHSVLSDRLVLRAGEREVHVPTGTPVHLDHAYTSTVHSAQGLTSDRVLIDLETFSRTTSKEVYYVAVSRARDEARIFTNSIETLPEAIMRSAPKTAALDLDRERTSRTHEHAEKKAEHTLG